jgi:hypothetical protein
VALAAVQLASSGSKDVEGFESIYIFFDSDFCLTFWLPPSQDKTFAKHLVCSESYHRLIVTYDHVACLLFVGLVDRYFVICEKRWWKNDLGGEKRQSDF